MLMIYGNENGEALQDQAVNDYFPAYRNLFAIPTTDLTANSNLVQNPGY